MTTGANTATILVLEPDRGRAEAIRRALETDPEPLRITEVDTLAKARASLQALIPDLVLAAASLRDGKPQDLLPPAAPEDTPFPLVLLIRDESERPAVAAATAAGAFDYLFIDAGNLADLPHRARRLIAEWRAMRQQRANAAEVREKEAFNFALFQHNPAAMVVVDREGHVIKSNLARRALDNRLPELGAPLYRADAGGAGSVLAAELAASLASNEVREVRELAWGTTWMDITFAPFAHGAVVIMEDITARKQAQAESERRQKQLIQADKMVALGNLVSGVAHEVSNPNNALILSATALRRMWSDLAPVLDEFAEAQGDFDVGARSYSEVRQEIPDMVEVINRAAERIKALVDDLKAYARKGSETLQETVDVNRVLDAAVNLMAPLIRKATQQFTVQKGSALPTIAGNAQQLEQVVINLLSNACQALPDRQHGITASTALAADTGDILIEVRDEGRGIRPEDLERITDPFFTTRQDDGGTGLGLSISKTIVDTHGGQLLFASDVGKGTVATIRLPVRVRTARGEPGPVRGGKSPS